MAGGPAEVGGGPGARVVPAALGLLDTVACCSCVATPADAVRFHMRMCVRMRMCVCVCACMCMRAVHKHVQGAAQWASKGVNRADRVR